MKSTDVLEVYDAEYAADYNDRFLLLPGARSNTDADLALLRQQLGPSARWLDIGCGTGYFLSQFPGVARAGYDLSAAMLARAQAASPDALFFRQGDFRNEVPEWRAQWSLVTCMWSAYSYCETVKEVEQVVANMITWTRPEGAIFIPILDLEELRATPVLYHTDSAGMYPGDFWITGCTWSWNEGDTGKTHHHLIAPQIEHFVRLLAPYFDKVEVVRHPAPAGGNPRRAVLATRRRAAPDFARPAAVTWPAPRPVVPPAATLPLATLLREVAARLRPGYIWRALRNRRAG
ncbi:class I SAM-dependent methyltransferase [Hymenobacter rubripertinctus]|uniref:Methyltransferase domain-containing protein n=1 Tax=Hymenobacter rubripertinctus TaxID=2029981 RepID=A0A418QQ12_9BACT|nr:methyltransferase domain-containing protein [Hymenobacter rubripertinctus]RIY07212.1 methyltransferase domain-containing protein [Hymenobacter rubripertinctus]